MYGLIYFFSPLVLWSTSLEEQKSYGDETSHTALSIPWLLCHTVYLDIFTFICFCFQIVWAETNYCFCNKLPLFTGQICEYVHMTVYILKRECQPVFLKSSGLFLQIRGFPSTPKTWSSKPPHVSETSVELLVNKQDKAPIPCKRGCCFYA